MCGRFSLGVPHAQVQEMHGYNVQVGEWIAQNDFVPRHNIAPRSQAPVLRRQNPDDDGSGSADAFVLQTMKWGLVPHWNKHEDKTMNTTNARSENLIEGTGMWSSIKARRRCAVICEGYFEWLKKGKERLPHFTKHANGNLMLLAGLYDRVILEGTTEPLYTFTIVTTAANKDFEWLHDRQPVILSSIDALDSWLDTSSHKWTADLNKILDPYHDEKSPLACYQVPKEVGKVGTESPTFIEPIAERKDGIQAMFARQKDASAAKTPTAVSPGKRKRSTSPSSAPEGSRSRKVKKEQLADAKPKAEKASEWEDDSDIECIDNPNAKVEQEDADIKADHSASQVSTTSTSQGTPKKTGAGKKQGAPSTKITNFFAKT